ncbi:MAG TPA: hypothetical protein VMU50_21675, partial [Polyangia bacterium]|nr:hypothetical protein [Polyangia bacterium]
MAGRAQFDFGAPRAGRPALATRALTLALAVTSPACGGGSGATSGAGADAAAGTDAPLATNGGAPPGPDASQETSLDASTTADAAMPGGPAPDAAADGSTSIPPGSDGSAPETAAALMWQGLANPIYSHDAWSVKDVGV